MPELVPADVQVPVFPSPRYLIELGTTHLIGDNLLRGSRAAITGAMNGKPNDMPGYLPFRLPANLRDPWDKWHTGGHLGEIGKSALVLSREDVPPMNERITAIHRSAIMMSLLGVTDAMAGAPRHDRDEANTTRFLNGVHNAFINGAHPIEDRRGPAQQADAFGFAIRAGDALGLDDMEPASLDKLNTFFHAWTRAWLVPFQQSRRWANMDPTKLVIAAQDMGIYATRMASVVVLGDEGHPALRHIGAIGGMEEGRSRPLAAAERGIHTYQTALVAIYGVEKGLEKADAERRVHEKRHYSDAQPLLETPRHRRVVRSVTAFARAVGGLHLRRELPTQAHRRNLEDAAKRIGR